MKKVLFLLLTITMLFASALGLTACDCASCSSHENEHEHLFNLEITTSSFLKAEATCHSKATYYYSCECGEKGTLTFESGELLSHKFTNYVSDNNATCENDGTKTATCDNGCGTKDTITDTGSRLEHVFVNGECENCDAKAFSEGLKYKLINNDTEYEVESVGSCTDTNIVIPSTYQDKPVTRIGRGAFYCCSWLTSLEIPNSVTSIGEEAFWFCSSLTSIKIPNSITIIGDFAFAVCSSLTSIEIPDSVTSIGANAFEICYSLTSIEIPNSVIRIGEFAFYCCYSLTNIIVDENNEYYKSIDGNLYSKDGKTLIQYAIGKSSTNFIIPDSVTSIGESAFSDCSSLTSIEIPDSITSIGVKAFSSCDSLTSIEIPDSVTSIGVKAFYCCNSLTNIIVDENNEYYKSIDGNLYSKDGKTLIQYAIGKSSTNFIIPDSVTSIGENAFYECSSLTSIEIPDSVTSIGEAAFAFCCSLTSIEIPDSVTSIGFFAFAGCDLLTSIEIPNSVTSIWDFVFSSCDSLTSIEIPNSVTSIGVNAFGGCDSLTSITFKGTVEEWNEITKDTYWNSEVPATYVECSNGKVDI